MTDMLDFPRRFEFTHTSRIGQFIRAMLVTLVGAALIYFRSSLSNSTIQTILLYLGGFIAVSGLIALLILVVLALTDKKQTVEVDDTSLTYTKIGRVPYTRTFKWSDVSNYELDTEAPIIDLGSWMDSPTGSQSDSSISGCLFSLTLGLYILLLQILIGGVSWKVKFRLKGKKSLSFSAPGGQMNVLVDQVLPHYLPGKRKEAKEKQPKKKSETSVE
jgi:hypothetical protein